MRSDQILKHVLILSAIVWLIGFILLPLIAVIFQSFRDIETDTIGVSNYLRYFSQPGFASSLRNSLVFSTVSTLFTVTLAYIFAYAITHTNMIAKRTMRTIAMLPIYSPSLLHAIALIYLFGNKGILTTGLWGWFEETIGVDIKINIGLYRGPIGLILANTFYLFPHALIILSSALSLADARLYEVSEVLQSSKLRTFLSVTLPRTRYGIASAIIACFTLSITDFGIATVLSPNFSLLATDIYRQVIGQQNFTTGSTISVVLLLPLGIGLLIDYVMQKRRTFSFSTGSVVYRPKRHCVIDSMAFVFCAFMASAILLMFGAALLGSLVTVWPYDLSLGLRHYDFHVVSGSGLDAFFNSVQMAIYTSIFGTTIVLAIAYLIEKTRGLGLIRRIMYSFSTLPTAVPGVVLGLGYIFFFNQQSNPLHFIYGTMAILVLSTIAHFFTTGFYTAMATLKQLDPEFESVADTMSVPKLITFFRVTLPISLPTIFEIALFFFVSAMTTVSAVIFLYSPGLRLATITIVNMNDSGNTAQAAAMSMLIFFTCVVLRLVYELSSKHFLRRTQQWRQVT